MPASRITRLPSGIRSPYAHTRLLQADDHAPRRSMRTRMCIDDIFSAAGFNVNVHRFDSQQVCQVAVFVGGPRWCSCQFCHVSVVGNPFFDIRYAKCKSLSDHIRCCFFFPCALDVEERQFRIFFEELDGVECSWFCHRDFFRIHFIPS